MRYRDFEITEGYFGYQYLHDEYEPDNPSLAGCCDTIEECKSEIDQYYDENN
jgi:hypothetical protein|tara:strand:- start:232 stop:387 length:156 start_codon:yes stop_codon:yes gene_type:complete